MEARFSQMWSHMLAQILYKHIRNCIVYIQMWISAAEPTVRWGAMIVRQMSDQAEHLTETMHT